VIAPALPRTPQPSQDIASVIYKRRPPGGDGIKVFGDTALLGLWLQRVSFE
jgi:hypothetical protein